MPICTGINKSSDMETTSNKQSLRMTWKEIMEKYPDQWVGLVDVEWDNASTVKTAVVKYSDKGKNDLLRMQIKGDIQTSRYTALNNVFSVGGLTLITM